MIENYKQKQPPEVFFKKSVLRNFAKFKGKHLCQSLFFNKVTGLLQNTSGQLLLYKKYKIMLLHIVDNGISKNYIENKTLKRPLHERIFMNNFTHTCHSFYILSSLTLKNIERTNLRRIHEGSFYMLFFN